MIRKNNCFALLICTFIEAQCVARCPLKKDRCSTQTRIVLCNVIYVQVFCLSITPTTVFAFMGCIHVLQ